MTLGIPPPKILLTDPQVDALRVVVAVVKPVHTHKRRSRLEPIPRVNSRAVESLHKMKLVKAVLDHGFYFSYQATEAGLAQIAFHYGEAPN